MFNYSYDETNPLSIEKYSQNLIGKTFSDIIRLDSLNTDRIYEDSAEYSVSHENKKRKGGLGDNDSNPDFDKAGVELKVTPYKINKNNTISAKERLSITMINYCSVVNEDFFNSHLWKKAKLILLVYYLYDKNISNRLDYRINYSKLFTPPKEDIVIIKHMNYQNQILFTWAPQQKPLHHQTVKNNHFLLLKLSQEFSLSRLLI